MRKGTPENAGKEHVTVEQQQELLRQAQVILPQTRLTGFSQIRDYDQACQQLNALQALLEKYPDQTGKIRVLAYANLESTDSVAIWENGKLSLDRGTISVIAGVPPKGVDPITYLMTQEFGHIMADGTQAVSEYQAFLRSIVTPAKPFYEDTTLQQVVRMRLISDYAGEDWHEALAEGFATMELAPDSASKAERFAHDLLTKRK